MTLSEEWREVVSQKSADTEENRDAATKDATNKLEKAIIDRQKGYVSVYDLSPDEVYQSSLWPSWVGVREIAVGDFDGLAAHVVKWCDGLNPKPRCFLSAGFDAEARVYVYSLVILPPHLPK
ncbi:MAG: hypothetical protein AAB467_01880 [Patescibacteria group bacterium]